MEIFALQGGNLGRRVEIREGYRGEDRCGNFKGETPKWKNFAPAALFWVENRAEGANFFQGGNFGLDFRAGWIFFVEIEGGIFSVAEKIA